MKIQLCYCIDCGKYMSCTEDGSSINLDDIRFDKCEPCREKEAKEHYNNELKNDLEKRED